jgi:hypothetical protein
MKKTSDVLEEMQSISAAHSFSAVVAAMSSSCAVGLSQTSNPFLGRELLKPQAPSGAKALALLATCGTAEAVPFPKRFMK